MLVVILTLPNTVTQLIKHILKNWALRTKDNMKQICNPWLPWCWINFFTEFLPTSSTKLFTIGFDFHDWGWCHFEFRQPGVPAMLDMLRSPGTPKASPLLSLEVEKPSLEVKEVLPLLQHGSFKRRLTGKLCCQDFKPAWPRVILHLRHLMLKPRDWRKAGKTRSFGIWISIKEPEDWHAMVTSINLTWQNDAERVAWGRLGFQYFSSNIICLLSIFFFFLTLCKIQRYQRCIRSIHMYNNV